MYLFAYKYTNNMKKLILFLLFINFVVYGQKKLPNLNVKNLDEKLISLQKDFSEKDKLYVFSFWATWCSPCIQELDEISEVYEDWKKELNIEIVAVSTDDSRTQKRVKPLVNGKGWDFTVLLDTNQEFKRNMGISNVPYLIVVKNEEIVFIQNGHSPGGAESLFEDLKKIKK